MKKVFLILLISTQANATKIGICSTSQSAFASATSVTWSHFVPDPSVCPNSLTIASCGNDASTFSSIRYAGIALVQKAHLTSTETSDIWVLANSTTTGVNNMVATNGAAVNVICGALTLSNVNTTTPIGATATNQATAVNPNTQITLQSSGSWVVDSIFNNGTTINNPPTSSSGTPVFQSLFNSGGPSTQAAQAQGPQLASGIIGLQWIESLSAAWTKAAVEVKVATGTPTVVTQQPTALTQSGATGNGVLLNGNGFAITDWGFCWNTTGNPTITDPKVSAASQGAFTAAITGLTQGTFYHVRAYATNSQGTDYGDDVPFAPLPRTAGDFISPGVGTISVRGGVGTISAR